MKTAKEMFEELGYELDEETEKEKKTLIYQNRWGAILFDGRFKAIFVSRDMAITLDFLKAINKQIEEFGW